MRSLGPQAESPVDPPAPRRIDRRGYSTQYHALPKEQGYVAALQSKGSRQQDNQLVDVYPVTHSEYIEPLSIQHQVVVKGYSCSPPLHPDCEQKHSVWLRLRLS